MGTHTHALADDKDIRIQSITVAFSCFGFDDLIFARFLVPSELLLAKSIFFFKKKVLYLSKICLYCSKDASVTSIR